MHLWKKNEVKICEKVLNNLGQLSLWAIPCIFVTTDTTQKNKSSYAEYLVLVLHCTHITCHGFEGNIQIQLNIYEISPFEQLCEKLQFFTLKITHSLAPIIMKY